jgi:hypothetical protein
VTVGKTIFAVGGLPGLVAEIWWEGLCAAFKGRSSNQRVRNYLVHPVNRVVSFAEDGDPAGVAKVCVLRGGLLAGGEGHRGRAP